MIGSPALLTAVTLAAGSAPAADPCAGLDAGHGARLAALLAREHPHACCDQTIAECLAAPKVCRLAIRLRRQICLRLAAGDDDATISRALARRARSAVALRKPATIDLLASVAAGDPAAPVTVVAYADVNGPNCARLMPQLYQAVTRGPLRGKAKLYAKPFPLRQHAHAKEGGLALIAAGELGAFWPLAMDLWGRFPAFDPAALPTWAAGVGIDPDQLAERLADPGTLDRLRASKREGLDAGVTGTPTLFIDGQRFVGDNFIDEVVDVVEEAYDRAVGDLYTPG